MNAIYEKLVDLSAAFEDAMSTGNIAGARLALRKIEYLRRQLDKGLLQLDEDDDGAWLPEAIAAMQKALNLERSERRPLNPDCRVDQRFEYRVNSFYEDENPDFDGAPEIPAEDPVTLVETGDDLERAYGETTDLLLAAYKAGALSQRDVLALQVAGIKEVGALYSDIHFAPDVDHWSRRIRSGAITIRHLKWFQAAHAGEKCADPGVYKVRDLRALTQSAVEKLKRFMAERGER